ncbi:putative 2OG-Fe(II) oxygenase [Thalassospiraceae bacterium LMO-JJ14]|nr:putative 2OG-Fe(II) oxygenase [Thalassospiraceae bacterium LMO-JJ14]
MAKARNRKTELRLTRVREALATGHATEALAEVRRLLASRLRDPAVLNLGGIAAFQCGAEGEARKLLEEACTRAPEDAEIRMNLGNVLAGGDDKQAALAAYESAHDLAPGYAEPAYNAGVLLAGMGRHADAADWFRKALQRDIEHTAAAIGRAEALRATGDLQGARAELEALIQRRPEDAVAYTNHAAVLSETGDDAGARQAALKAGQCDPGLAAAHFNLGVAEQALGEDEDAIQSYRRALALEPGHAAAALNQGEAFRTLGDEAAAAKAYARALEIDPGFAKAAVNLADLHLARGDAAAALEDIERFLSRRPAHPAALAFRAFALRDLGEDAAARELDDPDRFIMQRRVQPPDGYAGIDAFNAAIAEYLLAHPTLTPSPKAHATRMGRHSGELLAPPMGPMAAFGREIEDAFRAYRRQFAGEPAHPFLDACPDDIAISAWGVVMDEDGHQVAHIHPAAWLSGVYYAEVPDSITDDDPERAGWIEFGRPPEDIHAHHAPVLRLFKPEPGLMILFPSHFYHRTVPLKGRSRRISIAFDIMPGTGGGPVQIRKYP